MSTPAQAIPLQSPTDAATEVQRIAFQIRQAIARMQTSIVVQVQAVYGGGVGPVGFVDVLPLVDQTDGAGVAVPHRTIYRRPYLRWQGGANAVILDPQVDDLGLCCFASRDISSVITAKQHGPPPSARQYNFADGIYVGGMLNGTPTAYVQFLEDGTINLVSPVAVNIQAPNIGLTGTVNANGAVISEAGEITDAAGIPLGTHKHSGVQTGGSDTGGPVP